MAKARILKVVNYREEDIPTLTALEEILKREGLEFTEWARRQTLDYVKRHGQNPQPKLDSFSNPQTLSLPTAWEDPTDETLRPISKEEAKFMLGQLSKWYDSLQRKVKGR